MNKTLNNPNLLSHPATQAIFDWFVHQGSASEMKNAAKLAKQLCDNREADNNSKVEAVQRRFFALLEDGA